MESDSSHSQNNQNEPSPSNLEPMNYYGSFIFPTFTLLLATTCIATAIYTIFYNSNLFKNSYIPEYLFVSATVLIIDFSMMIIQSIFKKRNIDCRSIILPKVIRWLLFIGYSLLLIFGFIFCLHLDDKISNEKDSELSIAFFSTYFFIVFRAVIEVLSFLILKFLQRVYKKNERILNDGTNGEELLYEVITRDASPSNTHRKSAIDFHYEEVPRNCNGFQEDNENGITKNIDSNAPSRDTSFRDGESSPGNSEAKPLIQSYDQNGNNTKNRNKENSEENFVSTHSSSNLIAGSQLTSSEQECESNEINLFSCNKGYADEITPSVSIIEEYQESEIVGYEESVNGFTPIPQKKREKEATENIIMRTLKTSEHEKTDSSISLSYHDRTF